MAAAAVLVGGDQAGQIYEPAGDASFTLDDLAAVVAQASGKPMTYRDITPDAFRCALLEAGMPEFVARVGSDTDAGVAERALFDEGPVLKGANLTFIGET